MMRRRNVRSAIAALHDVVMAGLSFPLAVYLRLGDMQIEQAVGYLPIGTLLMCGVCAVVFAAMGLYRGMWRFASMRDMLAITKAVSLAMPVFAVCMFLLTRLESMPRSVLFINWLLLIWMLALPRFIYRAWKDRTLFWEMTLEEKAKIPVLVVGATSLAEQFIQHMARDVRTPYRVVGIVDDKESRHGRTLHRARIFGAISDLPSILAELKRCGDMPHKILIADHALSGETIQRLLAMADAHAVPVARIPRLADFREAGMQAEVQPVAIEDLLGRPQTVLDREAMQSLVAGKRVLVTGAGGSIGGELVRQLAGYGPKQLILLELSEYALYNIHREVAPLLQGGVVATLGDVRDEALLDKIFATHAPQVVFHAAAIKHVPIAEQNPEETLLTNVQGSLLVAQACAAHKVESMVLISSDKAVNPSSVMGASKRLAEMLCHGLPQSGTTRFITVRFGNVLGSTGSVVPLFQEQIARGGPVTVTDERMTRFFMTIREAVELVLQAAALGMNMPPAGKPIFVLDMGSPVKIVDLARQMIRLAGLKPDVDVKITYTGLRPGEKLHEALFHEAETAANTAHASIFLAQPRPIDYSSMPARLAALFDACRKRKRESVLSELRALVPEFNPHTH